MIQEKEIKSTYYGIGLLLAFVIAFIILPLTINDQIINYLSYLIFCLLKLGLIFYGQTTVKKLNRNYSIWSVLLFFFTSISLIILGQLMKLKKEITIIKLETMASAKNANNLPDLTIGTDSNLLLEALQNDTFTLNHMINNYKDFIKENTSLFPILAAYELNKRGEVFKIETNESLDKFAKEKGQNTFRQLINLLTTMPPEAIYQTYK